MFHSKLLSYFSLYSWIIVRISVQCIWALPAISFSYSPLGMHYEVTEMRHWTKQCMVLSWHNEHSPCPQFSDHLSASSCHAFPARFILFCGNFDLCSYCNLNWDFLRRKSLLTTTFCKRQAEETYASYSSSRSEYGGYHNAFESLSILSCLFHLHERYYNKIPSLTAKALSLFSALAL